MRTKLNKSRLIFITPPSPRLLLGGVLGKRKRNSLMRLKDSRPGRIDLSICLGELRPRLCAVRSTNHEEEIGGPRGRERRHNASNACARLNEECSCSAVEGGRGL